MADKRMISKSISISEKVNTLPDIFDMLLFTWMIPHSDDFGRLYGSATKVKALVVPLLEKSLRDVSDSLKRLHDAGCIMWYEVDETKYIQIVNFEHHQSGLHKRTKSKFPEFDGTSRDIPKDSRNFSEIQGQEKRTEEKGREENGIEGSEDPFMFIHEKLKKYNVEVRGVFDVEQIISYVGAMDMEVIEHCIKLSQGKGAAYALKVLDSRVQEGKTTKESLTPIISDKRTSIPDWKKKTNAELDYRDREIQFNRWVSAGNDPSEFLYNSDTKH